MPTLVPAYVPTDLSGSDAGNTPINREQQIGIAGRPFMLDLRAGERLYQRRSAPLQRQQFDNDKEAGEQSLGDGWWRRSQDDFSGGAGQLWLDKDASNRTMFYSSKGIDVFTTAPEWTLQHDTQHALTTSSTNLDCLRAENAGTTYIYVSDNQTLKRTSDPFAGPPASFTSITGTPAAAIDSMTSSGQYVYTAHSGNDVYRSAISGTTSAVWSTQDATLIRWVKQRIMGALANVIYEYDSAGTATSRYTHWNSSWTWTDFTEIGPSILAAGYVGSESTIIRFNIKDDGTLNTGVEAVEGGLPHGEVVNCLHSYLGYVFIGTNRGLRLAVHDDSGALTYGPLVPVDTTISVQSFESDDKFVWFGWTNYDGTSSGLGRLDLRTFTAPLRPAYASDLMATVQGAVTGIATHTAKRVYVVSGSGMWAQATTYVSSGVLTTSRMRYGTTHDKIAKLISLSTVLTTGSSFMPGIAGASGTFTDLGTTTSDRAELTVSSVRDALFSLRFTAASGTSQLTTPTFKDYTLKSLPAMTKQRVFILPLLLYDFVTTSSGFKDGAPGKALADLEFLEALEDASDTVSVEDISSGINGTRSFDCLIESIDFIADREPHLARGYGGVCNLTLRKI